MNPFSFHSIRILILLLTLGLAACPGGSNNEPKEEEPEDRPPVQTFTVGGTASGLSGTEQGILLSYVDASGLPVNEPLTVRGDGRYEFAAAIADGRSYSVGVNSLTEDGRKACSFAATGGQVLFGTIASANATADFSCADAYTITVTFEDLQGEGLRLSLVAVGESVDIQVDARTTSFEITRVLDGPYELTILSQPTNPQQTCQVRNGSGIVAGADVTDVRVTCGEATIAGSVTGLMGTGLKLGLSLPIELNGQTQMFQVEKLDITGNGEFEFTTKAPFGDDFDVHVDTPPSSPDQHCTVENGTGIVSGDIDDIVVRCPGPLREYRFDDNETRRLDRDEALKSGRSSNGVLHQEFVFESAPIVPLGNVSGFADTPLFQDYVDRPTGDGVVHSNEDGKRYWLIAESTVGIIQKSQRGYALYQQQTELRTTWRVRKHSDETTFRLLITKAEALAFDDTHHSNSCCSIQASARIHVHAHRIEDVGPGSEPDVRPAPEPFYSRGGTAALVGSADPATNRTQWEKVIQIGSEIENPVWTEDDFSIDGAAGDPAVVGDPRKVAYMELDNAVVVEVDLTDLLIGEEAVIISDAVASTHNMYTIEGGSAVYFQDPAEFDPGNDTGGVALIGVEGLEVLEIGGLVDDEILTAGGVAPGACSPSETNLAVIEFESDQFVVGETPGIPFSKGVRILRGGNTSGYVTARVSVTASTADPVDDFDTTGHIVRFGDESSAPRTLGEFIVDDDTPEGDETLTLTLHSPEGCATIGAKNTATVTIPANDPLPGTVAFASDAFDVDESAGIASITVERVGGSNGIVTVAVATSDGTGAAGVDYVAVSTLVIFQNGDATPRTVQVPIIDNTASDGDRTVLLAMSSLDPATVGAPANAVLTIIDNDFPERGTLQFGDVSYLVSEDGGSVTASVTRTGGSAGAVSVTVATSDGAATSPADFAALQTVVSFADGDTAAKTVDINIVDDGEDEGDHAFNLMLFDPTGGAELGTPAIAPVVIVDNDGAPPPPPGAAVLSVTAEPKQLVFDWLTVNDASFYRFMMDPTGIAGFTQVGNDLPLGETMFFLPVSVHLIDWTNARFMLQACNSNGCTDSNTVSAEPLMRAAIGYFKASNTDGRQQVVPFDGDLFGRALALSDDGRTLAVTGYNEDSSAVFVNGDQSDNSRLDSGAVYVFTAGTNGWAQQAYVKAPNTDMLDHFGAALAISADGNTLAVAAPDEASNATGVNGDQLNNVMIAAGAVYVYTRSAGVWSLQAYLKASNTDVADLFGTALAISDDGNALVVGAPAESSGATGLNGNQADNGAAEAGAVYVFTRAGSSWSQSDYVKASNTEAGDGFGTDLAISGDGATIAIAAIYEDSAVTGINGDQNDNSAPGNGSFFAGTGAVYVFSNASGAWQQEAYVKSSNLDVDDRFGSSLALSRDGALLVAGAELEDSIGTGVNSPLESDDTQENAGAAYVFARSGGLWQQAAYMKASNPGRNHFFGRAVDLSADGRFLIVGADGEDSKSAGINGDQSQSLNVDVGAAYLFERDLVSGDWSQRAYVKASNADQDSYGFGRELSFGFAVAISGDGAALAASGHRDNSDATGINGDQVNEDARQSGAVYVY